ncbi:MAG: hypothetical protein Q8P95_05355 [bacterium]|nr:hypothetical protein [bacterium]
MNLSFLTRFRKSNNEVLRWIRQMKKSPVFKRARFDVYSPSLNPQRLVILLGQMHTVWKGKIGDRERKKIVGCQARLCSYYAFLRQTHGLTEFGGEGMYEGLDVEAMHLTCAPLYKEMEKRLGLPEQVAVEELARTAGKILWELGKEWQRELRLQRNVPRIQLYAAAVSGQTLFHFLCEGDVRVYGIEGEQAYQHVLENINHLGEQMRKLEDTYEMRIVKQQGGRARDEKQVETVKQYNALVKEFNRVIGSDIRERATMEILLEKSQTAPLVVFTMGVGHRKNYLQLVNEYFKDSSTAFVFVTPPELLVNWWVAIGVPLLILIGVVIANGWIA